jgi:hypothetical protein
VAGAASAVHGIFSERRLDVLIEKGAIITGK